MIYVNLYIQYQEYLRLTYTFEFQLQRKIEILHEAVVNGDIKGAQAHLTRRKLVIFIRDLATSLHIDDIILYSIIGIILNSFSKKGRIERRKWSRIITQGRISWSYGYCVLAA